MDAKKKSIGAILAISIFATSCANHNNKVTVTIRGEEAKKTEKPTVETKEEVTWVQYDETALMYKVDLDRFLKDKLKLSRRTLQNEDVVNVLNLIREELGEDLYTKDKDGNKFCNLEGKSVVISAYDSRFLYFNFNFIVNALEWYFFFCKYVLYGVLIFLLVLSLLLKKQF